MYYKKTNSGLVPSSDSGQKHFAKLKLGETVKVSQGRHYEWEAKYFKMLKVAFDNQEEFESKDIFRYVIKLRTGFCVPVVSGKTGDVSYMPKSLADCTREEFEDHYRQCKAVILRDYKIDLDLMEF